MFLVGLLALLRGALTTAALHISSAIPSCLTSIAGRLNNHRVLGHLDCWLLHNGYQDDGRLDDSRRLGNGRLDDSRHLGNSRHLDNRIMIPNLVFFRTVAVVHCMHPVQLI
jgi:hypothetical protein